MHTIIAMMAVAVLCGSIALAGDGAREKVIFDTDMVEGFDDGVALLMLTQSPDIEVLGVTTVSGNSWASQGAAYAIRQLEIYGQRIPVYEGASRPLRPHRREMLDAERALCGMGPDSWVGCFAETEPESWLEFYRSRYGREPEFMIEKQHAVEFLIEAIRANPGEITIAAIGPCTNLALAVRQAPDIARLVKRVVYMGGSFFQPGNVTPTAEFNWWFDPEAARIAVRSDFPEQVVFGLDVCEKVKFTAERFDAFLKLVNAPYAQMLRGTYQGKRFVEKPTTTAFIWDLLVSAMLLDPTIISEERTYPIDVNDAFGLSYGQSLAFQGAGPTGSRSDREPVGAHRDGNRPEAVLGHVAERVAMGRGALKKGRKP